MKLWADIYDTTDTKIGVVATLTGCTVTKALDDIGSLSFSAPATDYDAFTLLTNERRVRLFIEHDDVSRELGRGIIRKVTVNSAASGFTLNCDCVGSMDALNRKSVLLGRSFTNTAISSIASTLVGLVSGWSAGVDAGLGNQTARYDGVSVFKALLRTAEEKGLHVREGATANTIDIGAFGDDCGVMAVGVTHSNPQLLLNDDIVLIDSITQETDSRDVVNWIIPMGAGEGSAAQTLKGATAIGDYSIGTMTAPDGSTLYYITDSDSVLQYGQTEKIITFKEIGAVSNSATAKIYAANALFDAASAWLDRNKDPLTTYKLTVRKPRAVIRAGQKITVSYKGFVETGNGSEELVPIALENVPLWIMKVTERISESGDVLDLQVSTVDRYMRDTKKIMVDAIESMQARNVSVQTFPSTFTYVYTDTIGWNGGSKPGSFRLKFKDYVTDVISVNLSFRTFPLDASTVVADLAPFQYNWALKQSYNYPSDVTVTINGVDRSTALGAPSGAWNFGGTNAALDVADLDITDYIVNDAGGVFQTHEIEFSAGTRSGEVRYDTSFPTVTQTTASAGKIEVVLEVLCTARATIPAP